MREEGGRFRALGKALDLPCDVPVETIEVPAAFLKAASAAGAPAIEPRAPARVGSQIREPRKIQDVRPVYPASARKQRIQGVVVLECTISPKGKVAQTRVLRGVPELDDAAVDAVKQWIYAPTLLDGVPVPVIMTVTVTFKIS